MQCYIALLTPGSRCFLNQRGCLALMVREAPFTLILLPDPARAYHEHVHIHQRGKGIRVVDDEVDMAIRPPGFNALRQ
jgi:hypothetical protein